MDSDFLSKKNANHYVKTCIRCRNKTWASDTDNQGVYMLLFSDFSIYVGSGINLCARKNVHFCRMRKCEHTKKVQDKYNKLGEPRFIFLTYCHVDELLKQEQEYMEMYKSEFLLNSRNAVPIP